MTLSEILDQAKGAKERSALLFNSLKNHRGQEKEWNLILPKVKPVRKAALLEAVEYLTKENPERGFPFLDGTIHCLDDKAPGVLREAGRVIANVAPAWPEACAKAVPLLLNYTKHEGTVVRWATAFALSQIALNHPVSAKKLIPVFNQLVIEEENKGVKNHYLKGLGRKS